MRDNSAALAVRLQTKFKLNFKDCIAVCLPNIPEFPIAVLGAIEAGLLVTTVNPIYTAGMNHILLLSLTSNYLNLQGMFIGESVTFSPSNVMT
jgi:acyl-CoA synthetase (AMP-forming)/AMP-acid ligase II